MTKRTLVASMLWILGALAGVAGAQVTVSCPAASLQAAVNAALDGTTILVSGTCNENIFINDEKKELVLDGQGTATINPAITSNPTVDIRGVGITIKRFTINGAIELFRAATATIDGNTIQSAPGSGIAIVARSFATVINNLIQNNGSNGILVQENASARIGFVTLNDTVASPNIIRNNGSNGILLAHASQAAIVGNLISGNNSHGINVAHVSQADISANQIDGNGGGTLGHAVQVVQNSGVNLGDETGTGIFDAPNTTTVLNNLFGVAGFVNSYADGRLGSLNGNSGRFSFTGSSINALALPDLTVTVADSPDPVTVGNTLTYSITVANTNGTADAPNVVLTDTLPGSVTLVSATASQGSCSGTSTVTCNLGTIPVGASRLVALIVRPNSAGTLPNNVTATSSEPDLNTADNSAGASTTVNGAVPTDLSVTSTVSENPINVGVALTYVFTIRNNGPNAAAGVRVNTTLPTGVTLSSAIPSQGNCSGNPAITCNLGSLAVSAAATVTILMTPTTAVSLSSSATVTADGSDPNTANNSVTTTTAVTANDGKPAEVIAPLTVPSATTGVNYTQVIPTPRQTLISATVIRGALPPGMTLTIAPVPAPQLASSPRLAIKRNSARVQAAVGLSNLTLTGTPTQAGSYLFTVLLEDEIGRLIERIKITVCNNLSTTSPLAVCDLAMLEAEPGVPYRDVVVGAGGTAPYVVALASGSLPAGLTIDAFGVISGTLSPTAITSTFTVRITDAANNTTTRTLTIPVTPPLALVAKLSSTKVGRKYAARLKTNGGFTPVVWRANNLPAGLAIDALTGLVSGRAQTPGSYNATIQATDSLNKSASVPVTLNVTP